MKAYKKITIPTFSFYNKSEVSVCKRLAPVCKSVEEAGLEPSLLSPKHSFNTPCYLIPFFVTDLIIYHNLIIVKPYLISSHIISHYSLK